jgi:hypothetical protein
MTSSPATTLLDQALPVYDFNEVHSTAVQASAQRCFAAIKELRASELSPLVHLLFAARALPARLTGKIKRPARLSRPVLELALNGGFVLLAEEADRELVLGTIGQFWKLSGSAGPKLADAREFLAFNQGEYAKAVMNFFVDESLGNGRVRVRTETRIHVPDPAARRKFAAYWRIIYPGSALIRRLWLAAIKRRAERG